MLSMRTVRLVTSWNYPPLLQQTPKGSGRWKDLHFTLEPVEECDYLIVLGMAHEEITVRCPPGNVWCILTEPPNEVFFDWHRAHPVYRRVFTQDPHLTGERFVHAQPALPWHLDRSYDELRTMSVPQKTETLSFLTSFKSSFSGHRERMHFLDTIRGNVPFDLIGTSDYYTRNRKGGSETDEDVHQELFRMGYTKVVQKKWEGLASYKYALVVENFRGTDYWSEKLTDCLLAYTLPIYSGCSNISDYFSDEAVVSIDIRDPDGTEKILQVLRENQWEKRLNAIKRARYQILEEYQLFPFLKSHIHTWEKEHPYTNSKKKIIHVPNEMTASKEMQRRFRRVLRSLKVYG